MYGKEVPSKNPQLVFCGPEVYLFSLSRGVLEGKSTLVFMKVTSGNVHVMVIVFLYL